MSHLIKLNSNSIKYMVLGFGFVFVFFPIEENFFLLLQLRTNGEMDVRSREMEVGITAVILRKQL